jgi:hypothetical protein
MPLWSAIRHKPVDFCRVVASMPYKVGAVSTFKLSIIPFLLAAALSAWAGETPSPIGVWRGESKCVTDSPSCHDEHVVYYIEAVPDHPDQVSVRADKIVNGKAITMGSGPWNYNPERQALSFEWNKQVWLITMHGDQIDGTLTTADKVIFRRMSLTRDRNAPQ